MHVLCKYFFGRKKKKEKKERNWLNFPHREDWQKKKKRKKWFLAHSAHLAVQYSIGPCLKVWYCHRPALFEFRLHSEIMDLYMLVVRVWNDVLPQGASLFRIVSPVISGNRLLKELGLRFRRRNKVALHNFFTLWKLGQRSKNVCVHVFYIL